LCAPNGACPTGPTVVAQRSAVTAQRPTHHFAIPKLWKNCTNVNKRYPHGVGKVGARDKTSGTPVTNFKRSGRLYRLAMSYNKGLDRDKDGIACEKA
jgi:hypothetical protein